MRMLLFHVKYLFLSILILNMLTACSTPSTNLNIDTANLGELESVRVYPPPPGTGRESGIGNLRADALQDFAMGIGAQGGLAWASEQINTRMEQDSKYL